MHCLPQRDREPASASASPVPRSIPIPRRRRFLFALGAGAAGTAASAVHAMAPSENPQAPAVDQARTCGYHETEHVRDYYATAKV
jgi:hypothetical protein